MRDGLGLLEPARGLDILRAAIDQPRAQLAAMRIDWARFDDSAPFFADVRAPARRSARDEGTFCQQLTRARPEARRALLVAHVQAAVSGLLGRDSGTLPRDRGLFEMGVDSLASLELRGALQTSLDLSLPATLIFSHPTIDAIADYVLGRLGFAVPAASALDGLPADEIARRLAERLDDSGDRP